MRESSHPPSVKPVDSAAVPAPLSGSLTPRPVIERSWHRSAACRVPISENVSLPFSDDFDDDSRLIRAARPVLDRLATSLSDTKHSILLADRDGRIIQRWVGMKTLGSRLDNASIAPGFGFTEEFAGTNGVGTALEERKLVAVHGEEHFSEWLRTFSCVGLPIHHPVRGTVEGIIDFTCLARDFSALIPPLVIEAAEHIKTRFGQESSAAESALFERFLRISRSSRVAVVAMRPNVFLTNALAARHLGPLDQAVLWDAATGILSARKDAGVVALATGRYNIRITTVDGPPRTEPGLVIRLVAEPLMRATTRGPASGPLRDEISGKLIPGRSVAWRRVAEQVAKLVPTRESVAIIGESGVGKTFVAKYLHDRNRARRGLHIMDASSEEHLWLAERMQTRLSLGDTVVIRRIERLAQEALQRLSDCAREDATAGRLIVTCVEDAGEGVDRTLAAFATRLRLPPLRQRGEDIADLIPAILTELGLESSTCELPALQALMRYPWPGNTSELRDVLVGAVKSAGAGEIGVVHLPSWVMRHAQRRQFSPMEQAEHDLIVKTLACTANRTEAAKVLGIGRATLYRKLRALGISNGELVK